MKINEFFKATYKLACGIYQETRPRIYCKDGFNMSVQAGNAIYCEPRTNLETGYSSAEIGFPSEEEPLINKYAENPNDYTETVYGYVPCELIDEVIEKHGGIDEEKTFERIGK